MITSIFGRFFQNGFCDFSDTEPSDFKFELPESLPREEEALLHNYLYT